MTSGTYSGLVLWQAGREHQRDQLLQRRRPRVQRRDLRPEGAAEHRRQRADADRDFDRRAVGRASTAAAGSPSGRRWRSPPRRPCPPGPLSRPYPTASLTGTGGGGAYTWSATGLPAGLSIDPATGDISGTPTAAGAPSVTVTLNDAAGDAPATKVVHADDQRARRRSRPRRRSRAAIKARPYSRRSTARAAPRPFTWSATGLPAGCRSTRAPARSPARRPARRAVDRRRHAHRRGGRDRDEEPVAHDRRRTVDHDRVAAPGRREDRALQHDRRPARAVRLRTRGRPPACPPA